MMNQIIFFRNTIQIKMNEWKGIYVTFNALLGYIGTATSEGMK